MKRKTPTSLFSIHRKKKEKQKSISQYEREINQIITPFATLVYCNQKKPYNIY